jgi:hypothetical protein
MGSGGRGVSICPATYEASLPCGSGLSTRSPRHPDVTADNNGSERELRPTATYRKVTGGFRSTWGANLYAAVRSVIGTATRRGIDAYQAIRATLQGQTVLAPG